MLFLFLELSIIHILKEWALFHLSVWTNDVIFFIELDINTLKMIFQNSVAEQYWLRVYQIDSVLYFFST